MSRPNIILTIADDQRYNTIAAHGNADIRTPNLDRLAGRGVSYRRAQHAGSSHGAVCAPSRAQLHTGRHLYSVSDSLHALGQPVTNDRRAQEGHPIPTLGELLGNAGYDTFAIGKWHNEGASFLRSFQCGRRIMLGGMSSHFCVPMHDVPAKSGEFTNRRIGHGHSTDLFAEAAVDFLKTRSAGDERPFFLYVAFTAPHDPRETYWRFRRQYSADRIPLPASFMPRHPFILGAEQERDEFLSDYPRHPDEARMHEADYYAMIAHLDEGLGRIHDALEQAKLTNNTLVIHTADHGLALGRHGLMGKQNLYDHSIRVPLIVSGPGFQRGIDDDRLCHQHDLFPTLLASAGVNGIATNFQHLQSPSPRETLSSAFDVTIRSMRDGVWKLIEYRLPAGRVTQLFDTQRDPDECHDLSARPEFRPVLLRLRDALRAHLVQSNDPFEW